MSLINMLLPLITRVPVKLGNLSVPKIMSGQYDWIEKPVFSEVATASGVGICDAAVKEIAGWVATIVGETPEGGAAHPINKMEVVKIQKILIVLIVNTPRIMLAHVH